MFFFFFFNDTAPTEIYTLSLHDALPTSRCDSIKPAPAAPVSLSFIDRTARSEEHTSELQSPMYLVCRLLLEKKKTINKIKENTRTPNPIIHKMQATNNQTSQRSH